MSCTKLSNFLLEISVVALFLTADVMFCTQEHNWKRYMYVLQEALGHRCQNDLRCLADLLSFNLLQGKKISPATKKDHLNVILALNYTYSKSIFRPQTFSRWENRTACTLKEKFNIGNTRLTYPCTIPPYFFPSPSLFLYSLSPWLSSFATTRIKDAVECILDVLQIDKPSVL